MGHRGARSLDRADGQDLEGKRIATEVVNITRQYLNENGVNAEVEFSLGRPVSKCLICRCYRRSH